MLHLRHELAGERRPPRCGRQRTRGLGVGHREQVQRRQPLGIADARGDVVHEVFVLEIASRRGVRKEQMLRDHEPGQRTRTFGHPHPQERLHRDPGSFRDVPSETGLPDVVQQGSEPQGVVIRDGACRFRRHRFLLVAAIEEKAHRLERVQQVNVDGEPVVRIALRAAANGRPGRDVPGEQSDPVEHLERCHTCGSRRKKLEEGVSNGVGPLHLFGEGRVGDAIEEGRSRKTVVAGESNERT